MQVGGRDNIKKPSAWLRRLLWQLEEVFSFQKR
jgi:hypothetical protein